jgi:hypothetical protein
MVTARQAEKAKRAALAELREKWWMYKRSTITDPGFIELCLAPCDDRCGQCEGCASEYYRQGKMEELAFEARFIKECSPAINAPWPMKCAARKPR